MAEFYPAMHAIVGELMNAENFYIALYDEDRQLLNFPYYVDSIDLGCPRSDPLGADRDGRCGRDHGLCGPGRQAAPPR